MMSSTRGLYSLAVLSLAGLQLSCGDSSGPGPVATTLEANSSTSFSSPPSGPVTDRPSVIVRDANGDVMAGVTVTFTVTAGGGTVTGGTQTTNSAGVATVGSWILGSAPGPNTLTASSGNLTPIVFTASSVDPCTVATPHSLGATTQGNLATGDCRFPDGTYVDFYETTLPAGTYLFDQASSTLDTYLFMLTAAGAPVGVNDDIVLGSNTNSRIKLILPAGSYILAATSYPTAPFTGAYTLSSVATTAQVSCEEVFVMKGITTAQALQSSDCASNGSYDEYIIFRDVGQSLTATMTSSAVDSFLTLFGPDRATILTNDSRGDGSSDAQFAHTATVAGFYFIRAGSAVSGSTGQYNLVLE